MFTDETQVMLYVADVAAAGAFWESLGFVILEESEADGTLVLEIAPSTESNLHLVLYDLNYVQSHSPEVNIAAPSILFTATDVLDLYQRMQVLNVTLGELVQLGEQLIFNFADPEGNYFAVSGPNQ
ncbi:VOC family protein [Enterococcus asini]|uniref:VOC family protein n=1 Tax=Enterococcus asini TaxID=57732 RepID=A0AAW8U3W1_9ENTE|nr:VOC family protein [Enterococcus asini]MDT2810653.1 VOC family protein [Enterococcus asini]